MTAINAFASPIHGGGGTSEASDGRGHSTYVSPAHHGKPWSPLPINGEGEDLPGRHT